MQFKFILDGCKEPRDKHEIHSFNFMQIAEGCVRERIKLILLLKCFSG
jgi:hypothetical protein